MSILTQSLYSLIKTDGLFKSEKQAVKLLSQSEGGKVYRVESYTFGERGTKTGLSEVEFTLDSLGVVSMVRKGHKTGKVTATWYRGIDDVKQAARAAQWEQEKAQNEKREGWKENHILKWTAKAEDLRARGSRDCRVVARNIEYRLTDLS